MGKKKQLYVPPKVACVQIRMERGFQASNVNLQDNNTTTMNDATWDETPSPSSHF